MVPARPYHYESVRDHRENDHGHVNVRGHVRDHDHERAHGPNEGLNILNNEYVDLESLRFLFTFHIVGRNLRINFL